MFQFQGCGKCGGALVQEDDELRCYSCGHRRYPAVVDPPTPNPNMQCQSEGGRHKESLAGRRGRPRLNLTDEERLERKRAYHREYNREYNKRYQQAQRDREKAEIVQRHNTPPKKCEMFSCKNTGTGNFQIAPGTVVWLCDDCRKREIENSGNLRL